MRIYPSELSWITVAPGPERKVKFQFVSSFPRLDPLFVDPFSPKGSHHLLVCLVVYPENLAWQLSGWEPHQYGQKEVMVALHLHEAWVLPTVAGSQGNYFVFVSFA